MDINGIFFFYTGILSRIINCLLLWKIFSKYAIFLTIEIDAFWYKSITFFFSV